VVSIKTDVVNPAPLPDLRSDLGGGKDPKGGKGGVSKRGWEVTNKNRGETSSPPQGGSFRSN